MKRYKYVLREESMEYLDKAMSAIQDQAHNVGATDEEASEYLEEVYDFIKSLYKAIKKKKEIVVLDEPAPEKERSVSVRATEF